MVWRNDSGFALRSGAAWLEAGWSRSAPAKRRYSFLAAAGPVLRQHWFSREDGVACFVDIHETGKAGCSGTVDRDRLRIARNRVSVTLLSATK